jgi:HK97 family phage major capsid protein
MRTTELSELTAKVTEIADRFKVVSGEHATRIDQLEKRAARGDRGNGSVSAAPSLGEMVVASDEFKELTSSFRGKALIKLPGVERADITSADTTVGAGRSAGTSLVPGARVPGIVDPLTQQFFVRDLIPALPTVSSAVEATVETGFTNSARPVTETTTKPKSDLTFNLVSFPVRTIAHVFQISRQIMDDAPGLAAYINKRGTYGLKQVEEAQLLTGNNVGQNLHGLIPQASAYDTGRSSTGDDEARILLHALSQAAEANAPVTGIVISQKDWFNILGIRDNQGRYLSDGPFGTTAPRIWNLPVVASNSMNAGEFLVGSFGSGVGAQIFDRMGVEVLISSEHGENFVNNELTVRIEERLTLATLRPEAFVSGSF